jgi:cell division protein FtsN
VSEAETQQRKEAVKVTMATILILNAVAVTGLLALLAATMRLPYQLPSSPGSGVAGRQGHHQRPMTSVASRRSRQGYGAPEPVYSR